MAMFNYFFFNFFQGGRSLANNNCFLRTEFSKIALTEFLRVYVDDFQDRQSHDAIPKYYQLMQG
jgi:hypothetical protein